MSSDRWIKRTVSENQAIAERMEHLYTKLKQYPLKTFLSNIDSLSISYRAITPTPKTNQTTTLLLLTGYNETIDKYCEFIDELMDRIPLLHVYMMDHRGQGNSGREQMVQDNPLLAHSTDWHHWIKDVEQFVSTIIQPTTTDNDNLHLFAHSMGGMIGTHVAAANPNMFKTISLNAPLYKITIGSTVLETVPILSPFARLMVYLGYDCVNTKGGKDVYIFGSDASKVDLVKFGGMKLSHCYEREKFWHVLRVKSVTENNGLPGVCMSPSFGWFNEVTNCYNELINVVDKIKCPVIITQAEIDCLVSNTSHHQLSKKMKNAIVLNTGRGSFHEQHYGGRDDVRKMILDAVANNIQFKKVTPFIPGNPTIRSLSSPEEEEVQKKDMETKKRWGQNPFIWIWMMLQWLRRRFWRCFYGAGSMTEEKRD